MQKKDAIYRYSTTGEYKSYQSEYLVPSNAVA
jgi:hypothetical protein